MDPQEFLEEMSRQVGDMETAIDECDAEEICSIRLCVREVRSAMRSLNSILRDFNRIRRNPDVC